MGFWAALPFVAKAASSLFGKKKEEGSSVPATANLPGFQVQAGQALSDYVKKYLSGYTPGKGYEGQRVAGMSDFEGLGLNRLNEFLGAPELGDLFGANKQMLMDTLGGKFADPSQSPFIKAMIGLSNRNLQDSIDASRRSAGSRGAYFTDSALREEGRLREGANLGLDATVGDFINQERGRQLQASPLAQVLEKYSQLEVPLAKVSASQDLGALPRLLEQAGLESQYQEFLRKQGELGGVVGVAQNLYGTNTPTTPAYQNPDIVKNNTLGNILGVISKLNLGSLSGGGSIWDKIGGIF